MTRLLPPFTTLLLWCLSTGFVAGQVLIQSQPLTDQYALTQFQDAAAVAQIRLDYAAVARRVADDFSLVLATATDERTFTLYRQELRSSGFQRTFASGRVDHARRPSAQFKGQLMDDPEAAAYFTFDDDFLMGHWEDRGISWVLEPLWLTQPAAARDVYLLFREDNLAARSAKCSVVGEDVLSGIARTRGWIGSREIDLAVAVDNLMYQDFPDAESLENFVLGLLALVQGDYDRGFNGLLSFRLSNLYFSDGASPEPWTLLPGAELLLAYFRDWGNAGGWTNAFDMAALWTGRDLEAGNSGNNNIGFAYIDATCSDRRYHVVENWAQNSASLRAIWSHEIGHNLGARHVSGRNLIMNGTLGPGNREWSTTARVAINNSMRNFNCLELSPWLLFNAVGEEQSAVLDWSFRWQQDNEGFYVERADNGVYVSVGWVPANDNQGNRLYRFVDPGLRPGEVYFYRLRQVNDDGTEFITPVERVVIQYPPGVRISPNPANDFIRIVSSQDASTDYRITDVAGRIVRTGQVNFGATDVNLFGLASGVYLYYELDGKETSFVTKFLKR